MRRSVEREKHRKRAMTNNEYEQVLKGLIAEWQQRYDNTDKGEWTKRMIPDVGKRYILPLTLDHYTSQMLTGHGNFRAQFYRFKLVNSPNCNCQIGGAETVAHILLKCKRTVKGT